MKDFKVCLFDFDGTLFDTRVSLRKVFRDAFAAVGIYDITDEECANFMHYSLLQTARLRNVPDEDFPALMEACLVSLDEPETVAQNIPFPETVSVLEALKSRGVRLAAVSGNTAKHINLVLDYHDYHPGFETIVGSDMYEHGKPEPDCLLIALQNMGLIPNEDVVYVGDSLNDMGAAKAAGVRGVLIDRDHEYPDYEGEKISSLEELLC